MNKIFTFLLLTAVSISALAQTQPSTTTLNVQGVTGAFKTTQPYGKVDMEDLEMKSCSFEPDANAEVLFDKASVTSSTNLVMERHVRIKIFNDFGKSAANIRLVLNPATNIKAETINVIDGKIEITQVEKKAFYIEKIDISHSAIVFTFPNVKPGSVIEYKYSVYGLFTIWAFQSNIPTRYSEIETDFGPGQDFKVIPHVKQEFVVNKGFNDDPVQVKALGNVHSLPDEPYMSGRFDNLQRIEYLIFKSIPDSWLTIGKNFSNFYNAGGETITGEYDIIKRAKSLKSDDEKIALIFDEVKNTMKWNEVLSFYTPDGTNIPWDKKVGNSTEINMIVYHLLKKAGINAYPIIIGDKKSGKINPANPTVFHFRSIDVYVPIDTVRYYILDATSKFNLFNTIPADVLNTYGMRLHVKDDDYQPIFLENNEPIIQSVFINAEIKPDGKMNGAVERTSYSYNKISALKKYKTDGEEKYVKLLCDSDNNIKMSSVRLTDMEVDSLPLSLKADFTIDLGGAENYIYFKTNLFAAMGDNPFKSEERYSDIDFGYRDNYSINGIFKIPAGFKIDALPKSVTIIMPDQSIIFKRVVAEDNGTVLVKYSLNHKKTIYFKEDYQDIRGFYKKMYELLNEQIVLKKL